MASSKKTEKQRITLVLEQHEADFLVNGAQLQEISVNQFARSILFPSAFNNALDKKVYTAIREVNKIPKEAAVQLRMQTHMDLVYEKNTYTWFERYNYIFLYEANSTVYYPVGHAIAGKKDPYASLYLIAVGSQSVGEIIPLNHFEKMYNLGLIQEPDNGDLINGKYTIADTIVVERGGIGYRILSL